MNYGKYRVGDILPVLSGIKMYRFQRQDIIIEIKEKANDLVSDLALLFKKAYVLRLN